MLRYFKSLTFNITCAPGVSWSIARKHGAYSAVLLAARKIFIFSIANILSGNNYAAKITFCC